MRVRAFPRLVAAALSFTLIAAACSDDDPVTETAPSDTAPSETAPSDTVAMDDMSSDTTMPADMAHDDDHDTDMTGDMGDMDAHDEHSTIEVETDPVPTLALEVFSDPAGGVNIHVTSTDYVVTPRDASTAPVQGEGHYHLYVDGEKVLRFYNDWIHFAGVTEGEAEITVELSANDHSAWAVDGEVINDTVVFTVPEHAHDEHDHGDPVPVEFAGTAPTLTLEVVDDPKMGWNAFLTVDGMILSPEHAGGEPVDGEGHLHIYANGQKLGRLYGLATHIPALPDGEVEITVAAYANDHSPYVIDGVPVEASATVTVAS